jgi:hypothetical protein
MKLLSIRNIWQSREKIGTHCVPVVTYVICCTYVSYYRFLNTVSVLVALQLKVFIDIFF